MFLGFTGSLQAQQTPKSFSVEPPKFIKELKEYIDDSKIESSVKVVAEFAANWEAGKLAAPQQRFVINTCNTMLMKKFRINPEFESYLATLNALMTSNQQSKMESWQRMIEVTMSKPRKNFLDLLLFTRGLFTDVTLVESASRKWRAGTTDFEFSMVNNEVQVKFKDPFYLYCITSGDTIIVKNTFGVFYATQDLWLGERGHIDWARAFLDTNKVFADFGRYRIDMKKAEFKVDTVTFYNKLLFNNPLKGVLTERAYMAYGGGDKALSPRFESFIKDFKFPQFKDTVQFVGGFGMKGSKILGVGDDDHLAYFTFNYKGKPRLRVFGREFTIGDDRTATDNALSVIYIDQDSIMHPKLDFNYNYTNKRVMLTRQSQEPLSAAPFIDTYHKLEFYVDQVDWKLELPKMDFRNINPDKTTTLESNNFFRPNSYERLQGILDENPIYTMRNYSFKNDTAKTFHIDDYAAYHGLKKSDVVVQVIELHDNGFLHYNPRNGMIQLRSKVFDYVRAYNKRCDYDVLRFNSMIGKRPNASLNFENNDLNVQGVPKFIFSDSQDVYMEPFDQQMNIRKNRDIDCAGHLHAGKFDFYAGWGPNKGFYFEYTGFKVQLSDVELKFLVEDSMGRAIPIKNSLKNIYGTLLIDNPGNKSGLVNYPEYPVLASVKKANVYYDYASTKEVNYDPQRFFFEVDPFTIDSLDNFDVASMVYDGMLHAGNITPDYRYAIKVMPDYSLGFFRDTLSYPLYDGKGNGKLFLTLSNAGYHGSGVVDYLASKSVSTDYFMHLDSMIAVLNSFDLKRTEIYPHVAGHNVAQRWLPYRDTMYVSTIDEDMAMFDNRAYLSGNAVLTPKSLYGDGKLSWENAELFSDRFNFSPVTAKSDKSTFRLASIDPGKFAIIINDVRSFVDYDKRFAEFKVNRAGQIVDLPYNQYQMAFTDYKWNMDAKTIDMTAREIAGTNQNVQKNFFRSVHPDQDSLIFQAGNATYYLDNYLVVAEKVPFIHTADARVVPDSNRVYIEPNALMRTLHNATVYTDTIKKYHTMLRCEIDIHGRKNFTGNGYYSYTDRTKKMHEIYFDNITVNKFGRTSAQGPIYDTMDFTLSPRIQFKGTATLISNDRNMEFDGYILPVHSLPYIKSQWFRHVQRISPDSVFIRFEDPKNEERQQVYTGMYVSVDSTHAYGRFFDRKRNYVDPGLTEAPGVLYFDDKTQELRAGSWDKFFKGKKVGNAVYVNDKTNTIVSEGKISFGLPKGKFNIKGGGIITGNMKDTSYTADMAMLIDIPLPDASMKVMGDSIVETASFSADIKYNNDRIIKSILELMDYPDAEGKGASEKELQRQSESMKEDNVVRMNSDLTKTFLISDVKMVWNTKKRCFTSKGKIGLSAVGKTKVDKTVTGKIEIIKKRSGDEVNILIEPVSGAWFYFKFYRGQLFAISSSPTFNQAIKDNMEKMTVGDYKLRFGSVTAKNNFQRGDSEEEEEGE